MTCLLRYLLGFVRIQAASCKKEEMLNLLRENNENSWGYFLAGGAFCLSTTRRGAALLTQSPLASAGLILSKKGILADLWHARARAGLLFGLVVSALIFLSFSSLVWDVRVEGNERLSNDKVLLELQECGLFVGLPIRDLDEKRISGDVLLSGSQLSFVSINMHGTVAYVTVRERDAVPETEKKACANLVATQDAVIESCAVSAGSPKVGAGQVVKKGDILVSGITEGLHGNRLVRAEGEIIGRVERVFSVTVPSEMVILEENCSKTTEISLVFFGKSINIYRNSRNLPDNYVTIYHSEPLSLWDSLKLPFGVSFSTAHSGKTGIRTLSEEEQVRLAFASLKEQMAASLQGAELLSKRMQGRFDKDGYTLTCTLQTLENIAIVQEFSVK